MDLKKELIELRVNMLKIDSLIMVSNRPIDANMIAMNSLNTITKLIEAEERKEEQQETTGNCTMHGVRGMLISFAEYHQANMFRSDTINSTEMIVDQFMKSNCP